MRPRRGAGDGSVTVEMVVLAPVLVILILFVVFVGRVGGSLQQVRHAADAGARAASLVGPATMVSVAKAVAAQDLLDNGVNCASTSVSVVVSNTVDPNSGPRPVSVTVSVSCAINTDGTALLGAGGRTVTASSTEVIDRYRGS